MTTEAPFVDAQPESLPASPSSSFQIKLVQPLTQIGSQARESGLKMKIDIYKEIIPEDKENTHFSELGLMHRFMRAEQTTRGRISNKCSEIENAIEVTEWLEQITRGIENNIVRLFNNQLKLVRRYARKAGVDSNALLEIERPK